MTPTTAAVMAVRGAVNLISLCVDSIMGAPAKIKTNENRKVNQVTMTAPSAPAKINAQSQVVND